MEFIPADKLINKDELIEFEYGLNGLKLPDDYKKHMLRYNGGETDEIYLWKLNEEIEFHDLNPIKYGYGTMEERFKIDRVEVLPESDIFIGVIRGGDICISLTEAGSYGSVYIIYSDGKRINLASSFTELLNGFVVES
ncbi:hypothetical protein DS884_06785 [Tenacibaculum sp. E3R01]|uniref:SMI1/KNR4 family protein n=1 Tax=Tenacibaculum sp. E3R01 TaxID=2267227 RepID=UPI000DEBE615|nr:SMI1/KNR4 family protein [Tenacibaculum sp. E3R01]RBW59439.1 hypothetical protein DS884_06785 [Tenacibaculum sp. E3R01]